MSLDIQIKVDPGDSAAKIKSVTDGLSAAEQRGKAAGESMLGVSGAFKSLAAAMQQEQAALGRLNTLHEQLAVKNSGLVGSFRGVAEAMQREQNMLEKINGPARQYMEDLQSLDSLLAKNAISTQQYTEQVTKMNQAIEQTPKQQATGAGNNNVLSQLGSIGGTAGGVLGAVAGGGLIAGASAGINAIEQYVDNIYKLEDEYTNLINHEMKFTDSTHTLSMVMSQQRDIATALHATLKETADVYDSVQDATADLNLSSTELASLTKVIGQEAAISGKSMASAGDVLNRMFLAMQSGADAGRALKTALVGYDAISDTLTAHFHTTRDGLIAMVNAGKLGPREITEALEGEAAQVQKNFDLRKVTHEQQLAMINEEANTLRDQGIPQMAAYALASSGGANQAKEAWLNLNDALHGNDHEMDGTLSKVEQLTKDLENMSGGFAEVGKAEAKTFDNMIDDVSSAGDALGYLGHVIATALGNDPWAGINDKTGLLKYLPLGTKTALEFADATAKNKEAIDDLNAAYVSGAFGDLNNPKSAARATGIFLEKLEALTAGLEKQKTTLGRYNDQLANVRHTLDGLIDAANHIPSKNAGMLGEEAQATGDAAFKLGSTAPQTAAQQAAEKYRLELAQLDDMIARNAVDQTEVNNRLAQYHEELNKATGAVDANVQRQHDLQAMLDQIKKPQQDYAHDLDLVNQLLADGAINAQEYADRVATIRDAYAATQKHSNDFATGLEHGWNDIVKQATDSAGQIETAMKGAFDAVNSSIVDMVTTGDLNLSKLGSSIEQILVKLALQQVEGAAIGYLGGGSSVPHFATGGSGTVGGTGGTDSQLFIARVTPGEHYQFTPPGQAVAASGGGGTKVVNYNVRTYDRNAIISNKDDDARFLASLRRNIGAVKTHLGR